MTRLTVRAHNQRVSTEAEKFQEMLSILHSQIDRSFQDKLVRLEQERQEKHAELDRLLTSIMGLWTPTAPPEDVSASPVAPQQPMTPPPILTLTPPPDQPPVSSNGGAAPRKLFRTMEAIIKIINGFSEDSDIDQQVIYNALIKEYPELAQREPVSFKSQIVGTLNKLVDQGRLRLVRKGAGLHPNIYRRAIYQPQIHNMEEPEGIKS